MFLISDRLQNLCKRPKLALCMIDSFSNDSEVSFDDLSNRKLTELVGELKKENEVLKAQFEDVVALSDEMKGLHAQNAELATKNRNLKSENEDIKRRIEILVQNNNELKSKLETEKKNHQEIADLHHQSANEQVSQRANEQIRSLTREVQQAQDQLNYAAIEKRKIVNKVDKVISAGSKFFNTQIEDLDEILALLSKTPNEPRIVQNQPKNTNAQFIEQLDLKNKKIKKLKKKILKLSEEYCNVNNNYSALRKENQELSTKNKHQANEFQSKLSQLKDEHTLDTAKTERAISALKSKIDLMNLDIEKKTQENKRLQQQLSNIPESTIITREIQVAPPSPPPKQNDGHDMLLSRITAINDQLKVMQKRNEELSHRCTELEALNDQYKAESEKQQAQKDAQELVYQEALNEIKSLRSALHAKSQAPQPKPQQPDKAALSKLNKTIEAQQKQITAQQSQINKLQSQNSKYEQQINQFQQIVANSEKQVRKSQQDLFELQQKVRNTQPITEQDLLPDSCWHYSDFDITLSDSIDKIARNPAFQASSKLRNIYRAIYLHYNTVLKQLEEEYNITLQDNDDMRNNFNQFLVDLSIGLFDQPVSLEDFRRNRGNEVIIQQMNLLKSSESELTHEKQQYIQIFGYLCEQLGRYHDDPIENINAIKNHIDSLNETISQKTKKCNHLRTFVKALQKEITSKDENYNISNDKLVKEKSELEAKLNNANNQIKSLKRENLNQANKLTDIQAQNEEYISKLREEFSQQIDSLTNDKNNLQCKLATHFKSSNDQFVTKTSEVEDLSSQLQKTQRLLTAQKALTAKLESDLEELRKEKTKTEAQLKQHFSNETSTLQSTFERSINQLRSQFEAKRADVQKLSVTLSESESKYNSLRNEFILIQKDNDHLKKEIQSLEGQLEREKKLMETATTTKKVTLQAEYDSLLDEQKGQHENEQYRIFAYVVDTFRSYFNVTEQINESSFRAVIDRVNAELTKLTSSDQTIRRLLHASERQTTQDAVAQLMFDMSQ